MKISYRILSFAILIFATLGSADVLPMGAEVPVSYPLAVPQIRNTELYRYYKDTKCIRVDPSDEFVPYDQRTRDRYVSFEICDTYKSAGRQPNGDRHICGGSCKPLLPELYYHPRYDSNVKYYFDVEDIGRYSLVQPDQYLAAMYVSDFMTFLGGASAAKIGFSFLKLYSRRTAQKMVQKELARIITAESRASAEYLSGAEAGQMMSSDIWKPFFRELIKQKSTSGIASTEFIAGITAEETAMDLIFAAEKEFGYDYWYSLKRYTNPDYFNDRTILRPRIDDFRLVTEKECTSICSTTFPRAVANKYMEAMTQLKGCSYDDFQRPQSQVSPAGKALDACTKQSVDNFVLPFQRACRSQCQNECVNPMSVPADTTSPKYRGQTLPSMALTYLLSNVVRSSSAELPALYDATYQTECVDFPKYKELSIPEIAILWASLIRNSAPFLEDGASYPSPLFRKVLEQANFQDSRTLFSLEQWEPLIVKNGNYFTNPYRREVITGGQGTFGSKTTYKQGVFYKYREEIECPGRCEANVFAYESQCLKSYPHWPQDPDRLGWWKRYLLNRCIDSRMAACEAQC